MRAIRRVKWDQPIEFWQKGHEDQFFFNADRFETATKKMNLATDKESKVLQEAYDELKEGISNARNISALRISPRLAGGWWKHIRN